MNKIRQITLFVFSLFFLFISTNCAQKDNSNSITVQQFKEKLKIDKDLIVLDVRTPEELIGPLGKIDSVINIPVQVLEQRITELAPYKDKEIIVICRTQNRSAVAVSILEKNGYKAKNVLGGMTEYRKK